MKRRNEINDLLTVKEVSKTLKLSQRTVYRLIEAGRLNAIKISRKAYRIPEEELVRFLEKHKKS